jgi:hypothetical protein
MSTPTSVKKRAKKNTRVRTPSTTAVNAGGTPPMTATTMTTSSRGEQEAAQHERRPQRQRSERDERRLGDS